MANELFCSIYSSKLRSLLEHCTRALANTLLKHRVYSSTNDPYSSIMLEHKESLYSSKHVTTSSLLLVKGYSSTTKNLLEHGTQAEVNSYSSKLTLTL